MLCIFGQPHLQCYQVLDQYIWTSWPGTEGYRQILHSHWTLPTTHTGKTSGSLTALVEAAELDIDPDNFSFTFSFNQFV